jgi:alanine racemase
VNITGCREIQPGDAATLLGVEGDAAIDAQQIGKIAGTISYSVLWGSLRG